MEWKIFKAYDIRGVYPSEVNESAFYKIAQGFVSLFRPKAVVVGMDARLSSPSLKRSLIAGFIDSGVDVVDIGRITTDMIYFAVPKYDLSGGLIVSASHNPKDYNGLKIVRERARAVSSDTGLFAIRDALMSQEVDEVTAKVKGNYEERDIVGDYIDHVMSFINPAAIRSFKIVANGNFGCVSRPVSMLADRLPLEILPLNFEPDGSFPKGQPDPLLPQNRAETEEMVRKTGADFGVAWDGDGDRVMFFDENGEFISGVYVSALFAKLMLAKHGRKNKVIYDPRIVWPVLKTVREMGAQPIMSKAGHAFIKDRMASEDALFGGELSAHYFFRDNFFADNGIIPLLMVMEHLSESGKKLSEVIEPFTEGHHMSGELNFKVKDVGQVMERVRRKFEGMGLEDFIDGYTVETESWRFNLRPSNTEPLLRLNIEAKNDSHVAELRTKLETIIQQ